MKRLFFTLCLIASFSIAGFAPIQNKTSDVSESTTRRGLVFNQNSSQTLAWRFTQGTTPLDLTSATAITFAYLPTGATWIVSQGGTVDTNGTATFNFPPSKLATNGTFSWRIDIDNTTQTLAYAWGELILIADPRTTTNLLETTPLSVNWSRYVGYASTSTSGPVRPGTGISATTNADGSITLAAASIGSATNTLDEVTAAGNTTTNSITVGGIELNGGILTNALVTGSMADGLMITNRLRFANSISGSDPVDFSWNESLFSFQPRYDNSTAFMAVKSATNTYHAVNLGQLQAVSNIAASATLDTITRQGNSTTNYITIKNAISENATETNQLATLGQVLSYIGFGEHFYQTTNRNTTYTNVLAQTNSSYYAASTSQQENAQITLPIVSNGAYFASFFGTQLISKLNSSISQIDLWCYESGAGSITFKPELYFYNPVLSNFTEWADTATNAMVPAASSPGLVSHRITYPDFETNTPCYPFLRLKCGTVGVGTNFVLAIGPSTNSNWELKIPTSAGSSTTTTNLLRIDGSNSMTGPLNLGGQNITNAGAIRCGEITSAAIPYFLGNTIYFSAPWTNSGGPGDTNTWFASDGLNFYDFYAGTNAQRAKLRCAAATNVNEAVTLGQATAGAADGTVMMVNSATGFAASGITSSNAVFGREKFVAGTSKRNSTVGIGWTNEFRAPGLIVGTNSYVGGILGIAHGVSALSSGDYSFTHVGSAGGASAAGDGGFASGYAADAAGLQGHAIGGVGSSAAGEYSLALCGGSAAANRSIAIGDAANTSSGHNEAIVIAAAAVTAERYSTNASSITMGAIGGYRLLGGNLVDIDSDVIVQSNLYVGGASKASAYNYGVLQSNATYAIGITNNLDTVIRTLPKQLNGYTLRVNLTNGTYSLTNKVSVRGFQNGLFQMFGPASNMVSATCVTNQPCILDTTGIPDQSAFDDMMAVHLQANNASIQLGYIKEIVSVSRTATATGIGMVGCGEINIFNWHVTEVTNAITKGQAYHSRGNGIVQYDTCTVDGFLRGIQSQGSCAQVQNYATTGNITPTSLVMNWGGVLATNTSCNYGGGTAYTRLTPNVP